jgi:hypothetical protein
MPQSNFQTVNSLTFFKGYQEYEISPENPLRPAGPGRKSAEIIALEKFQVRKMNAECFVRNKRTGLV